MKVHPDVQREADLRASRWWNSKGENAAIRRARVQYGAKMLSLALGNLDLGDIHDHQRRTVLHAVAAIERLQHLSGKEDT